MLATADLMDRVVSLSKRWGFLSPSPEIYSGDRETS